MACQGGGAVAIRLPDKQVKGNIRGMGGAAVRQGGGARGAARLSSWRIVEEAKEEKASSSPIC